MAVRGCDWRRAAEGRLAAVPAVLRWTLSPQRGALSRRLRQLCLAAEHRCAAAVRHRCYGLLTAFAVRARDRRRRAAIASASQRRSLRQRYYGTLTRAAAIRSLLRRQRPLQLVWAPSEPPEPAPPPPPPPPPPPERVSAASGPAPAAAAAVAAVAVAAYAGADASIAVAVARAKAAVSQLQRVFQGYRHRHRLVRLRSDWYSTLLSEIKQRESISAYRGRADGARLLQRIGRGRRSRVLSRALRFDAAEQQQLRRRSEVGCAAVYRQERSSWLQLVAADVRARRLLGIPRVDVTNLAPVVVAVAAAISTTAQHRTAWMDGLVFNLRIAPPAEVERDARERSLLAEERDLMERQAEILLRSIQWEEHFVWRSLTAEFERVELKNAAQCQAVDEEPEPVWVALSKRDRARLQREIRAMAWTGTSAPSPIPKEYVDVPVSGNRPPPWMQVQSNRRGSAYLPFGEVQEEQGPAFAPTARRHSAAPSVSGFTTGSFRVNLADHRMLGAPARGLRRDPSLRRPRSAADLRCASHAAMNPMPQRSPADRGLLNQSMTELNSSVVMTPAGVAAVSPLVSPIALLSPQDSAL
eukprot:TRINITY_DN3097_c3_g2_i1.p1 TRINITY_DN3097_c3_g2~~TRINITY_DN3097_c3_g2_i1.p1  ORF type:complete len:584 (+),score=106.82 TRINITY_DN3097_c3_g2_i1:452-2203(+)